MVGIIGNFGGMFWGFREVVFKKFRDFRRRKVIFIYLGWVVSGRLCELFGEGIGGR